MKWTPPRLVGFALLTVSAIAVFLQRGEAADAPKPEKKPKATFEVYEDKGGEFRWRLRAQNTKVLATSSDGYKEKRSCLAAIESVKRDVPDAPVIDQPKEKEATPDPVPAK